MLREPLFDYLGVAQSIQIKSVVILVKFLMNLL